ncbi:MAG: pilus assembly protein [Coprococcus sp.]|nr:pilus assembly protein [Coprococcus sp.]
MVRRKQCQASTVVEMAYLMPVVLLVWMLVIFILFYYHDKNILSGAAYETAVVGSELIHEEGELKEDRTARYFQERIDGKMLFFGSTFSEISADEESIHVRCWASSKGLRLTVEKSAAVTEPERKIRKKRAILDWAKEVVQ